MLTGCIFKQRGSISSDLVSKFCTAFSASMTSTASYKAATDGRSVKRTWCFKM